MSIAVHGVTKITQKFSRSPSMQWMKLTIETEEGKQEIIIYASAYNDKTLGNQQLTIEPEVN